MLPHFDEQRLKMPGVGKLSPPVHILQSQSAQSSRFQSEKSAGLRTSVAESQAGNPVS
jgi:hypothetical protein